VFFFLVLFELAFHLAVWVTVCDIIFYSGTHCYGSIKKCCWTEVL